jgi:hypothetical protein
MEYSIKKRLKELGSPPHNPIRRGELRKEWFKE